LPFLIFEMLRRKYKHYKADRVVIMDRGKPHTGVAAVPDSMRTEAQSGQHALP
jgi:hypothetical protein